MLVRKAPISGFSFQLQRDCSSLVNCITKITYEDGGLKTYFVIKISPKNMNNIYDHLYNFVCKRA